MAGRMTHYRLLFALTLVLLCLAGCAGAARPVADTPQARQLLIRTEQLPREYRLANGQDYPGELTVCDVLLEPSGVRDFANKRFTRTYAGPFLDQYVFITDRRRAGSDLVDAVDHALRTCREPTITTGEGDTRPVELTRLQGLSAYGSASIGFRVDPRGRSSIADYLVIQRGNVVFLLFTVGLAQPPPRALLTAGAEAAMGQLARAR